MSESSVANRTEATTSPSPVNLMAFPIRFMRTWRKRPGSPERLQGPSSRRCPGVRALVLGQLGEESDDVLNGGAEVEVDTFKLQATGVDL
jgi:hypothetical protein